MGTNGSYVELIFYEVSTKSILRYFAVYKILKRYFKIIISVGHQFLIHSMYVFKF